MRMVAEFGFGVLVILFILALYGIGAAIFGALINRSPWIESARRSLLLVSLLLSLVFITLIGLLITQQFNIAFVAQYSTNDMPLLQRISTLWMVPAGVPLSIAWLVSIEFSIIAIHHLKTPASSNGWVIATGLVTMTFFLVFSIFIANPFIQTWRTNNPELLFSPNQPVNTTPVNPIGSNGTDPLSSSPGWILQSALLFLGLTSLTIPFAYSLAALLTRTPLKLQLQSIRPWIQFSWLALSLTLVLEFQRVYSLLGRGNVWTWESNEIAILLPWLVTSLLLHFTKIPKASPNIERINWLLLQFEYPLFSFSIYLLLKGLSPAASSLSAKISLCLLILTFLSLVFLAGILVSRWKTLSEKRENLSSPYSSWKDLLNFRWQTPFHIKKVIKALWGPVFISILLIVVLFALGIRSPLTLGTTWIFALGLLIPMVKTIQEIKAQHSISQSSLGETVVKVLQTNVTQNGNLLAHLGVVMILVGMVGMEVFQSSSLKLLHPNESLSLGNYNLTLKSLSTWDTNDNRNIVRADISVQKNGIILPDSHPRRDYYYPTQQTLTIPAIQKNIDDNLYILLIGWQTDHTQSATLKVFTFPLINWIWVGSIFFMLGTFLVFWREYHPLIENSPEPGENSL